MRHLALALVLLGCGSAAATPPSSSGGPPLAVSDGEPDCRLTDGTVAAAGTIAPSTDGTNTCTCGANRWWSCTELAFHPAPPSAAARSSAPGPARAHYVSDGRCALSDGTVAVSGTVSPSDDGCNTCTCGGSGWECTDMACPE